MDLTTGHDLDLSDSGTERPSLASARLPSCEAHDDASETSPSSVRRGSSNCIEKNTTSRSIIEESSFDLVKSDSEMSVNEQLSPEMGPEQIGDRTPTNIRRDIQRQVSSEAAANPNPIESDETDKL